MELSFGEMLVIVLAIVVLFGPDKIPEDVKSEIMKDTDNPISDIKKEIDKVKKAAQEYDPTEKIKQELDLKKQLLENNKSSDELINESKEKIDQLNDDYNGPVSR